MNFYLCRTIRLRLRGGPLMLANFMQAISFWTIYVYGCRNHNFTLFRFHCIIQTCMDNGTVNVWIFGCESFIDVLRIPDCCCIAHDTQLMWSRSICWRDLHKLKSLVFTLNQHSNVSISFAWRTGRDEQTANGWKEAFNVNRNQLNGKRVIKSRPVEMYTLI